MPIETVMPSNHVISLSSPSPPAFNLSQHQGLFQWVGSSHQVVKVLEHQLQHPSFLWMFRVDFLNIFRIDWFDLLEVPGTLKSLLQNYSSKESYTFNKKHEITSPPVQYFSDGHSLSFAQDNLGEGVISIQLTMWALRSNLSCTA